MKPTKFRHATIFSPALEATPDLFHFREGEQAAAATRYDDLVRRRVFTIIAFLLLGAVINVAVAWGLALTVHLHDVEKIRGARWNEDGSWELQKWSTFGGVGLYSARGNVGTPPSGFGPEPFSFLPRWSTLGTPTTAFVEQCALIAKRKTGTSRSESEPQTPSDSYDDIVVEVREVDARGWPAIAMWSETEWMVNDAQQIRGGIPTGLTWQGGAACLPKVLPLRPIWPGFAINTLFYAAILWLLIAAPFALRRRRRIKHGLCPKCAYPVGSSEVCTECGAVREVSDQRAAINLRSSC